MNNPTSLADNETVIEFFSSHLVRASKRKKQFRRRLILVLVALPKILAVAYLGYAELIASHEATAADVHAGTKAAAPFIR